MGNNNAARGAYFKNRTRKWLTDRGYQVGDMEVVRYIYRPGGDPMPVKRDQFGADLIAMSATEIVFVQVKGGASARSGSSIFVTAAKKFHEFDFPPHVQRWVIAWPPRAREPRIWECVYGEEQKQQQDERQRSHPPNLIVEDSRRRKDDLFAALDAGPPAGAARDGGRPHQGARRHRALDRGGPAAAE